jgi:hypothetical protein
MTSLSRKRELARSIELQLNEGMQPDERARRMVGLLLEYLDRALGFARLELIAPDEFAETDHMILIVLGSRSLLAELADRGETSVVLASELLRFRADLSGALLTPGAATLEQLRERTEELQAAMSQDEP